MQSSFKSQLVAAGLLVAGLAAFVSSFTPAAPAAHAQDDPMTRGKWMAESICIECHSPRVAGDPYKLDPTKLYAGGEPFEGPWGKVYSKNITSDPETGIGAWTFAEIKAAVTRGIHKDGKKLLVMPWELFQGLADDDVNAIVTYLRSLPPIKSTLPPDTLAPPQAVEGFVKSIPPLAAVVPPELYARPRDLFHDFVFARDPAATPPPPPGFKAPEGVNSAERGGYLVRNLLGCTVCHAANLAGGTPPFNAPNITQDAETGIGNWTNADITKLLKEGIRPDGRKVSPIMPATTAFVNLPDVEVGNVVAFLRSVPPVRRAAGEPNPAFGPPPAPPVAPVALPNTGDGLAVWLALAMLGGGFALAAGLARLRGART